MYVLHVCTAPREAVRHQLPYEAGGESEGGQKGGAGGGGEETLQIGFYMDHTQKEEHLPSGPYQVYLSAAGAPPPEGAGCSLSIPRLAGQEEPQAGEAGP